MLPRGLYTALAVCTLAFNVVAGMRRPHLETASKRAQERARDRVLEATRPRPSPRHSSNNSSPFLNSASESESIMRKQKYGRLTLGRICCQVAARRQLRHWRNVFWVDAN